MSGEKKIKEKIENFLNQINNFKDFSEYLPISELIWKIYNKTGFYNFAGLMKNGNLKQANLKMLFERAKEFEKSNLKGLYNFIRYLENLKINNKDLSSAKIIGENENVVRIMSIHKSKGLEFPYVFLCNTNKKFNLRDLSEPILLHQSLGIGPEFIDYERKIEYPTVAKNAIKLIAKNESISEEMRVLYVALTRAKEKIIITAVLNNYEKELSKKNQDLEIYNKDNDKLNTILLKKYISYFDWIDLVYSKNEILKNEMNYKVFNKNMIKINDDIKDDYIKKIEIDENVDFEKVQKELEWKYIFQKETLLPIKSTVTKIKQIYGEQIDEIINEQNIGLETRNPVFIQKEKMSFAQKGTVMHLILQNLNFNEEYDSDKIKRLIEELTLKNKITEEERKIIDEKKLIDFCNSEFYKQISKAKQIYKETPFCTKLSAKEYYDANDNSSVLVQGIIDLYYIDENDNIILVDYKTDRENDEKTFIKRYQKQLEIYAFALEKFLNKKIYKKYIFSMFLNKEIEC